MPKAFMYFPFSDYLLDQYPARMEDCLREVDEDFEFEVIYTGGIEGSRGLEIVGSDDLLLPVSHGDIKEPDAMFLCTRRDVRKKTANDLADQMMSEGLPKTHQSILLMNCWGGGDSTMKPGAAPGPDNVTAPTDVVVTKNGYLTCLASVLAKALGLRGYFSILVGGFPGVVNQAYTGITFEAGASRVRAQIDHIQWFDCRGQSTSVRTASGPGSQSFATARQQLGQLLHPMQPAAFMRPAAPVRPATRPPVRVLPTVPQRPVGGFRRFKP